MLNPAETRGPLLMVLGLLVAGSLLSGCGSGGVGPTPPPTPSQTPAGPVSVSQLTAAPAVTDLAGRFAYGTDVGHIWVVDAATGNSMESMRRWTSARLVCRDDHAVEQAKALPYWCGHDTGRCDPPARPATFPARYRPIQRCNL